MDTVNGSPFLKELNKERYSVSQILKDLGLWGRINNSRLDISCLSKSDKRSTQIVINKFVSWTNREFSLPNVSKLMSKENTDSYHK